MRFPMPRIHGYRTDGQLGFAWGPLISAAIGAGATVYSVRYSRDTQREILERSQAYQAQLLREAAASSASASLVGAGEIPRDFIFAAVVGIGLAYWAGKRKD